MTGSLSPETRFFEEFDGAVSAAEEVTFDERAGDAG